MLRTIGYMLIAAGLLLFAAGFFFYRKTDEELVDLTSKDRIYDRIKVSPGERISSEHAKHLSAGDRTAVLEDGFVTEKLNSQKTMDVTG